MKLLFSIRSKKYDCVVNCHRYASSGILAGFSGAHHIAGFKQNPFSFLFNKTAYHRIGDGTHEVDRYYQLIDDLAPAGNMLPKLYPIETNQTRDLKTHDYVCMAPASVWFTKQLPESKWIELCNQIPSEKRIYLLGAAGDHTLCENIRSNTAHQNIINLAGKLNLMESCSLIKDAGMNYVNDSAPLHLASAVNAPVTAFFCSTIPEFGFGPLSKQQRIIQVNHLDCRPCGLHGHKVCPKGHFKCGNEINVQI